MSTLKFLKFLKLRNLYRFFMGFSISLLITTQQFAAKRHTTLIISFVQIKYSHRSVLEIFQKHVILLLNFVNSCVLNNLIPSTQRSIISTNLHINKTYIYLFHDFGI